MSAMDVASHPTDSHLRRLRAFAFRSASLRFSMVYDDHSPRCRLHRDAPTIASRRHRAPFSVSAPHLDCVRATSPTSGLDRRANPCRMAGPMSSVEGARLRAVVHGGPSRLPGAPDSRVEVVLQDVRGGVQRHFVDLDGAALGAKPTGSKYAPASRSSG